MLRLGGKVAEEVAMEMHERASVVLLRKAVYKTYEWY